MIRLLSPVGLRWGSMIAWVAVIAIAPLPACTCSEPETSPKSKPESSSKSSSKRRDDSKTKTNKDEDDAGFFLKLVKEQNKYHMSNRGRFRKVNPGPLGAPNAKSEIERLEALGYAGGTVEAPSQKGVTAHDEKRAYGGYNFYTSGHAPEATLMDMEGNIIHRWSKRFLDVWPDRKRESRHRGAKNWRRAHLMKDGSILAIYEGKGIVKLDAKSNLLWANESSNAHHDLEVMPDGDILVLGRKAHRMPSINKNTPVTEEFIIELSPTGKEKRRVSLIECWKRSEYTFWRKRARRRGRDFFHTNTLHVLDEHAAKQIKAFDPGDVMISSRHVHAIGVVSLDERKVVWAHRGNYRYQHDPKILDNGHLLLFDNQGKQGRSAVIEYQLPDMKPVWKYRGSRKELFFSATCGAAQRLPNGNTLVTSTDAGRAFELTPSKDIVWEFYNPERAGDKDQYIATLAEMQRIPPDFPLGWAENPPAN